MTKYTGKLTKFLILVIAFTILSSVFLFTDILDSLTPSIISEFVMSFGIVAPIVFILLYALGTVLAFPGSIMTITGGAAFGALNGTIFNVLGATIGSTLAFLIARYMGRDFVSKFEKSDSKIVKKIDDQIKNNGFQVIFLLRLIPIVPFNALNYASGLSKLKLKDYLLGTLLGIIPGSFAYTYFGANLMDIFSLQGVLAIVLLVALSFLPKLVEKIKNRVKK